ncbi:MAG: D-alanine--D-alanine ligase family protein [Candidatus Xenobia bacterium]
MRIAVIMAQPVGREVALALQGQRHEVFCLEADVALPGALREVQPQVVFLTTGADGTLQGMLDFMDIPYTGSGILASALTMHRGMAKGILTLAGVPTAPWVTWTEADGDDPMEVLAARHIGLPIFASPAEGGGKAEVVATEARLREVCRQAPPGGLLLEVDRPGTALSVIVLDEPPRALTPVGVPALSDPLRSQVQEVAMQAHRALKCRGLSEVDITLHRRSLEDPWEVLVAQVRTLPTVPHLLAACAADGLPFETLVAGLVEQALARRGRNVVGGARA